MLIRRGSVDPSSKTPTAPSLSGQTDFLPSEMAHRSPAKVHSRHRGGAHDAGLPAGVIRLDRQARRS